MSTTPALIQSTPSSRPYRIFTKDHCSFEDFAQYRDGGPSMVTLGSWGVSYSSTCTALSTGSVREAALADPMKVTLSAYAAPYTGEKHPLDGTRYATDREARKAAFEAGLIGFMVYEAKATV